MNAGTIKTKDTREEHRILKPKRLMILGANVAERRRILGIEQNDFAKQIEIRSEVFRHFELGKIHLDKETIKRIAKKLNCTVLELYGMQ